MSSDKEDVCTKVSVTGLTDVAVKTGNLCSRKYVAAVYDNDFYIQFIIVHNDKEGDILVKFMEKRGQDTFTFSWPQREDKCHIPLVHVLCTLPAPSLYGWSGQQYRLEHTVIHIVCKNFLQYVQKRRLYFNCMYSDC
jgi:hypothetical protein